MISWIKRHKFSSAITFLFVGLVIGLGIAIRANVVSRSRAFPEGAITEPVIIATATEESALNLQDAFIRVAETVGPAVVSIVTETTHRIPARRFYFGPPRGFFDEDTEEFFKEFFGRGTPEREFKQQGLGSGAIIDKEGYIITNDHVIGGADKVTVILPDGRRFEADVKGKDPRSDLAVIKIEADDLPVAKFGDSDSVRTGQWVVAIGNPFGFVVNNPKPTVTVGVVSALHRSLPLGNKQGRNYIDLIQTDAAINPGNSGGPLCDLNGNIIGLNVAIYSTTGGYQGVGFAIPINTVKWAVDDLVEGRKVLYGWLGVAAQELSHEMAEYFNIEDRIGVIVVEVIEDGPADKGGIKPQDIIRTFNGKEVDSLQALLKHVGEARVNERSEVRIKRDGKEITLTVIVGERPIDEAVAEEELTEEEGEMAEAEKWRGLTVAEITDENARKYGIEKQTGVLIIDVEIDSSAYDAGLRRGLIIKGIDKNAIQDIEDYNNAVQETKGSALVRTDKGYVVIK